MGACDGEADGWREGETDGLDTVGERDGNNVGEDVGVTMPSHTHSTGAVFPLKQLTVELPTNEVGELVTLPNDPTMPPSANVADVHSLHVVNASGPRYVPWFPQPIQKLLPDTPVACAKVWSRFPRVLIKYDHEDATGYPVVPITG